MLTLLLIFFPILSAVLIMISRSAHAKTFALVASLIEFLISVVAVIQFDPAGGNQFLFSGQWIISLGISFSVALDGIGLLLVLLTTGLVPLIILSAFGGQERPASFYGLILIMQMALIGVFTAQDGILFYLFWEVALIPIYFICLLWGEEGRARVTLKFFIYTLAGSLFMLIAIVYMYYQTPGTHSFDIHVLYAAGQALPAAAQGLIFWAMFVAFAIKMPLFPFHTWQPDTYAVAPVQGTMLLSGLMLKMGIYGLIRWLIPMVPLGVAEWGKTAIILSVIGVIYGSCLALVQKDFKRLVAYSSIAHVGLIAAGLLTLSPIGLQGAMIQMLSHGIIVVGLFYIIEIITQRTNTRQLADLGGIRNAAPKLTSAFLIVMLGSVALPLTSGFVGEFLLINSLVQYSTTIGAIAGLTIILGAVYMFKTFQKAMSGEPKAITSTFADLNFYEKVTLFPIVCLVVLLGVYPAPFLRISEAAVNSIVTIVSNYSASIN